MRSGHASVTLGVFDAPHEPMTRPQIAAATSLAFSLYWAAMAYAQWPAEDTPDAPLPMMRLILCVMFAGLAGAIWLGRKAVR